MKLEKLEKLYDLKEKGILTDEEFEHEKKKLLNETIPEITAETNIETIAETTNETINDVHSQSQSQPQNSELLTSIFIVVILLIIFSLTNCNKQPSFDYDAFARHVKSIRNY